MVNSKIFEDNNDLMVTFTDDETKILHKIGTEEYYDDPVDLIIGVYEDGHRKGQPKGLFEYEEVAKNTSNDDDDKMPEETEASGITENENQR